MQSLLAQMTPEFLGILQLTWVVVLAVFILLQGRSPVATVAWILALVALPWVGIAVYLVFGPRRLRRKRTRRLHARKLVRDRRGDVFLARCREAVAEGARRNEPAAELAELAVRAGESPWMRARDVTLFFRGDEAFAAIEAGIRGARHHVHLEYYIFESGELATRLLTALVERARAGVEVRLLIDALGSAGTRESLFAELRAAGGSVAYFSPLTFAGLRPALLNFRTHRKIVVCDGRVAFTGGMNVADGHDERVVGARAWRDTHVRVEGDAATALALVFLEDWAFAVGDVPDGEDYLPMPEGDGQKLVQVVASGPDAERHFAIHQQFFAAIAGARERVYLTTPYFVPDEATSFALVTAARRGVDVRLLVPAEGDHAFVAAAARAFYPELVASGVRIHEYEGRVLHAKTLVVDQHYGAVGTANFDARSFHLNFEVIVALYDAADIARLAEAFETDLAYATMTSVSAERARTVPQRLVTSVARLFAPIL